MPSLKDLKNRISSVKATQKITKAMQMVAAAKLRRAQEAAEAARPYAGRMEQVIMNLTTALEGRAGAPKLVAGTGSDDVHLLIVATSERGLCGGFNGNIAKLARQKAMQLLSDGKQVKMICIGRKGFEALTRQFDDQIIDTITLTGDRHADFPTAKAIARQVLTMFDAGEFDVCTLFYSKFRSVISQEPTGQQIIPAKFAVAEVADETPLGQKKDGPLAAYEFESDESEILEEILPRNLAVQILSAILENAASEQGARMSAMDNATRNAGDMIDRLTLQFNRARQAMITKELIEIISGAEAL
jgi:F-type H+-transporting ATPase subunit gamma